jgi:prepilin-type N-terminal cleavage/methylation domain-containing protein
MKISKLKCRQYKGFTIIEVIIVLAIAALILVIVFLAVPEAQKSVRDNHRKEYARAVFQTMEEYWKNNGKFPGCLSPGNPPGCTNADMTRFLSLYLPAGRDPSTGLSYRNAATSSVADGVTNGVASYYFNSIPHNTTPAAGHLYIASAHWCYASQPDDGDGPPLAGIGADNNLSVFSIVIYQERGRYYCLDNYAPRD